MPKKIHNKAPSRKHKMHDLPKLVTSHVAKDSQNRAEFSPIESRPDKNWIIGKDDLNNIIALFPDARFAASNARYLTINTTTPDKIKYPVSAGRLIMHFILKELGFSKDRGFVVGYIDGNPFNLRRANLKLVPALSNNSNLTHWTASVRESAVLKGLCPDEAILNFGDNDNLIEQDEDVA